MFDELLPWRGKGAQIQIQEEIEIASKPGIVLRVRPSLKVIGCGHDQIVDGGGDYVLAVKANQETLYDDIMAYMGECLDKDFAGVKAFLARSG